MTSGAPLGRRRIPKGLLVASIVVVCGVVVGDVVALTVGNDGRAPASSSTIVDAGSGQARAEAVSDLLAARGAAVQAHDEAGFLATVDHSDAAFLARQRTLFTSLNVVPFSSFRYVLGAGSEGQDTAPGGRWSPDVTLKYQIADYDPVPSSLRQHDTFVYSTGRWLLRDDGFDAASLTLADAADTRAQPAVWDLAPISVVRGSHSLVIGTGDTQRLRALAVEADRDVADVTAVWGANWAQRAVLVVPGDLTQFELVTGERGDLSNVEAVQSTEQFQSDHGVAEAQTANRITINPEPYAALSDIGRRVVITHELAHVAVREVTSAQTPLWLVEGFADYVGFLHSGIPIPEITTELRSDLLVHGIPTTLPPNRDFIAGGPQVAAAYEAGWMVCRTIVRAAGVNALLQLYRTVGTSPGSADEALSDGLAAIGMTTPGLTAQWRSALSGLVG